jgi:flagellar basal-body rod protein FlgB
MRELFEKHINLTTKVMDLQLERQNIVTGNISNVNTPGYRTRRLEFEKNLQSALNQDARGKMTRTQKDHLPAVFNSEGFQGDCIKNFKAREIYGLDAVDLDKEMAISAKNAMVYNALTTVIKKSFADMQKVIQSGSR